MNLGCCQCVSAGNMLSSTSFIISENGRADAGGTSPNFAHTSPGFTSGRAGTAFDDSFSKCREHCEHLVALARKKRHGTLACANAATASL